MNEPKTTVLAKATPSIPSKNGHVRTHRLPDQIHTGPRPNYQQRKMQLTVNHHHAPRSTAIIAGWIVLLIGFVIALIPGLGLSMMLLSIPFCSAAFILGIIGAANGKPMTGVILIIGSLVAFVVFWILPWLSSAIGGMLIGPPK